MTLTKCQLMVTVSALTVAKCMFIATVDKNDCD